MSKEIAATPQAVELDQGVGVDDPRTSVFGETNKLLWRRGTHELDERYAVRSTEWALAENSELLSTAHLGTPRVWSSHRKGSAASLVGLNGLLAVLLHIRPRVSGTGRETRNDRPSWHPSRPVPSAGDDHKAITRRWFSWKTAVRSQGKLRGPYVLVLVPEDDKCRLRSRPFYFSVSFFPHFFLSG